MHTLGHVQQPFVCILKCRFTPSLYGCMCRLVIAHQQFDPYHTAIGLLPLLAPSRPFVIWCTTLQPLAECAAKLQREPYVLNLQLCDTMSRPQQVRMLPWRLAALRSHSSSAATAFSANCSVFVCRFYPAAHTLRWAHIRATLDLFLAASRFMTSVRMSRQCRTVKSNGQGNVLSPQM